MLHSLTVWASQDMSEQLFDFNGHYVLVTVNDMKKIPLGNTLKEAKKKLRKIGRADIAKQLR